MSQHKNNGIFNPTKKTAAEMKGSFPDMNERNEYEDSMDTGFQGGK